MAPFLLILLENSDMFTKKDFKIYLVDQNTFYINLFQQHLYNLGYNDVTIFSSPEPCMELLNERPDIIFYDHGSDFEKELALLKHIKRLNPDIYLIFICNPDDVDTVIQSLKFGAFDYFVKGDRDAKNIEIVLNKIIRVQELLRKNSLIRYRKFYHVD